MPPLCLRHPDVIGNVVAVAIHAAEAVRELVLGIVLVDVQTHARVPAQVLALLTVTVLVQGDALRLVKVHAIMVA